MAHITAHFVGKLYGYAIFNSDPNKVQNYIPYKCETVYASQSIISFSHQPLNAISAMDMFLD
jgi:hypothetical protein